MTAFINSYLSELLKTKRSLATWMVAVGSFFTPAVIIVARLVYHDTLPELYGAEKFWNALWRSSWESMAIMFLPMGAILSTSLIANLEYKNNTWKQLHTLPLSYPTIYFSKLGVILTLMAAFFVLFNIGIYLSAIVPYLLVSGTPYPAQPIPYQTFARENLLFFVDCLPIVALQYVISLRAKNFLVPVGLGFVFWVGAVASLSWRFGYVIPYTYTMFNHLKDAEKTRVVMPDVNIHVFAAAYFVVFTVIGYILYVTKKEKG